MNVNIVNEVHAADDHHHHLVGRNIDVDDDEDVSLHCISKYT